MYGFSADENHLLFMDCFGLTRLSRPKQVKTDGKISGSESAGLVTVAAEGDLAASYEDLWDKSILWAFPELKSSKRFDRFRERGAMILPDGAHYLTNDYGKLTIKPAAKTVLLPLRLDAPAPTKKKANQEAELALEGGDSLPPLKWGKDQPNAPVSVRVAPDGTLLRFDGKTLVCATLSGTKAEVHWRRQIAAPDGARLEIYADAERCVLMLHQGRRWLVCERRGDKGGKAGKDRQFEIESLAVPTVAGRYLAYQPAAGQVVRRDLDDDAISEFSLAIVDKKRKVELDHEGMGTIFAGAQGSLLFLPHHRESLLDLVAGVEIPRKLPAKELEVRQGILAVARPYCEAARLAGLCIELGRVELNPKYNSVSITHRIAGGQNLFGALLAGYSQSAWSDRQLPGGWRMSSYGSHGGIGCDDDVSVAQLVEGYGALAKFEVGFAPTIGFWGDQLDRDGAPKDTATLALLAQMLVATVRDGAKAKLDLPALAKRGAPTLDEILDAYALYPTRTQELDYSATRLSGRLFNRLYGADAAKIWRLVYLESDRWEHYGSHYGDFDHYAIQPLLEAHPEAAEVFRSWLAGNPKVPEDRRWYVDQLRERLG